MRCLLVCHYSRRPGRRLAVGALLLSAAFLLGRGPTALRATPTAGTLARDADGHPIVIDDAGRTCRACDLQAVELRVETDPIDHIGHTYLQTPGLVWGFYPDEKVELGVADYLNPLSPPIRGFVKDDTGHRYDYVRHYRACPATVAIVQDGMRRHADDRYQLGNWGGHRNCATWALDRLSEAGLTPPDGDRPNALARDLAPAPATAIETHPRGADQT